MFNTALRKVGVLCWLGFRIVLVMFCLITLFRVTGLSPPLPTPMWFKLGVWVVAIFIVWFWDKLSQRRKAVKAVQAKQMTLAQIAEAQRLARDWKPKGK